MRYRLLLGLSLCWALAPVGCRHDRGVSASPVAASTGDAQTDPRSGSAPKPDATRRPGAAHTAHIDFLGISLDAAVAITRDGTGAVRLWTALDGSVEPAVVPVRGAQFLSAERSEDGITVFAVDASGGGKVLTVDDTGRFVERGALPPFAPLFEGHVLPGGERILVLHRDHSMRLLDVRGKELARYEARRFRPRQLRLSDDGQTVLAVIPTKRTAGQFKAELQRLRIEDDGTPRIARLGSPKLIETATEITRNTAAMSPDGERFAAVNRVAGTGWEVSVHGLGDPDAAPERLTVQMPAHIVPSLGFVAPGHLFVSTNDGALSWMIDIEGGKTYPRTAPPQDFTHKGKVQAFGRGRQVAGFGTWLFVHEVDDCKHRFLGYGSLQAQTVAVSPSGKHVAWGYIQGSVYVEPVDADVAQTIVLPGTTTRWPTKIRFFDDEHVVVADTAGGLTLYHWPTRDVVATEGIPSGIRNLEIDASRNLMLVDGQANTSRVYEISTRGFGDVHVLADRAYRSGLLAAHASDQPVVWTLDSGNRLRHYTLDELRGDLSREASLEKGQALGPGQPAPLAIDARGRRYGIRWDGRGMELFVEDPARAKERPGAADAITVPGDNVTRIVPSPEGDRFVAVTGAGQAMTLRAYDAQGLRERWSFSTGVHNNDVVWSPDGRFVAVAAMTGAVLLDAATGEPVRRRCGLDFQVSGSPPPNPFNSLDRPSLCE